MRPKANPKVIEWIDKQASNQLYTSSITIAEIHLGIALLNEGKKKRNLLEIANQVLIEFKHQLLYFDRIAAIQYADIVAYCSKKGRPICTEDAQIASITKVNKMILVTRNIKDFEIIQNLQIIDPFN